MTEALRTVFVPYTGGHELKLVRSDMYAGYPYEVIGTRSGGLCHHGRFFKTREEGDAYLDGIEEQLEQEGDTCPLL